MKKEVASMYVMLNDVGDMGIGRIGATFKAAGAAVDITFNNREQAQAVAAHLYKWATITISFDDTEPTP